jgi:hypothetical protein
MTEPIRHRKVLTQVAGIHERRRAVTIGRGALNMGIGVQGREHMLRAFAAALMLVSVAACSDSGVKPQPGETSTVTPATTPAASPTPTIPPEAQEAVDSYKAFIDASNEAKRHPVADGDAWPSGADFTKYSFDPIKTQYEAYIWGLESQGVEFRGTPATPHIAVTRVDLRAKPWPTVTLKDCPTGGHFDEYSIKTNKKIPDANGDIPPPYLITAKVIHYKNHWGVQSTSVDKSRTCTA